MGFLINPELDEFAVVLRSFLEENLPIAKLRKDYLAEAHSVAVSVEGIVGSGDWQREIWEKLLSLGVLLSGVPEEFSGLGFGAPACYVAAFESGRALCPLPLLENLLFTSLLLPKLECRDSSSEALRAELLSGVFSGKDILSGDLAQVKSPHCLSTEQGLRAREEAGDVCLSGELSFVPALDLASRLIVQAVSAQGDKSQWYVLQVDESLRSSARLLESLDLTRKLWRVKLDLQPAKTLGSLTAERGRNLLALPLVAELSGVAARVMELTLEYAKTREQFGKKIGSFQALQHKLADMYLISEQVDSLLRIAAWSLQQEDSQFDAALLAAKGFASEKIPELCEQSIQIHGGIGFTFEYDLHLYLRRAQTLARFVIDSEEAYAELARTALL